MEERRRARLDVGELLAAVENAPPVAAADVVGELLAETLDAAEVAFLIADFGGEALIRLSHAGSTTTSTLGPEVAERVPIAGSAHGRALADQAVQVDEVSVGWRVLAPVTNRGEAIGVLELFLADEPDEQSVADVALAAHALAYVVIANRRFTDLFEWGQRSVALSLAAEIQHRLIGHGLCGERVLVDEAAESATSVDRGDWRAGRCWRPPFWGRGSERTVAVQGEIERQGLGDVLALEGDREPLRGLDHQPPRAGHVQPERGQRASETHAHNPSAPNAWRMGRDGDRLGSMLAFISLAVINA